MIGRKLNFKKLPNVERKNHGSESKRQNYEKRECLKKIKKSCKAKTEEKKFYLESSDPHGGNIQHTSWSPESGSTV